MKILKKIQARIRKQKILAVSAGTLLLLSAMALERSRAFSVMGDDVRAEDGKICVVVDAGHGGSNLRQ